MSREFSQIRDEIEAKILWCTTAGVSSADRELLERLIAELEAQALAERQGKDRPPEPVLPSRPVPPRPPPVPELPKSERYHSAKADFDRQIELFDREIGGRRLKRGRAICLLGKRNRLISQRSATLDRILREEVPEEQIRRRDEAEAEHRAYPEAARRAAQSWDEQRQEWLRALRQWEADPGTIADRDRDNAVQRLRRDLEDLLKGRLAGPPTEKLNWRLLPPPEPGEAGLTRMLTSIQTLLPGVRFDEARMEFAYDLGPVRIYVGRDGFGGGYLAFCFDRTGCVLLDCPMEGNAAYIFRKDWKILSRLSKTELLNYHPSEVERVIHDPNDHWRFRIKARLGL